MGDSSSKKSLQDLDERLRKLREEVSPAARKGSLDQPMTGLGAAWLIASHLVTGLVVGAGLGYLLDDLLGSRPGMMIAMFFLGGIAGMRNAYRTAQAFGRTTANQNPPAKATGSGETPPPEQPRNDQRRRG